MDSRALTGAEARRPAEEHGGLPSMGAAASGKAAEEHSEFEDAFEELTGSIYSVGTPALPSDGGVAGF